jgi:TolA-binding protein
MRISVGLVAMLVVLSLASSADARPRRPSAAQIKKMKEDMEYRQREMIRVQTELAAVEKELFDQFDENKDGRLLGVERSRYDKHREQIRIGKAPNPFSSIAPLGQGPRKPQAASGKK